MVRMVGCGAGLAMVVACSSTVLHGTPKGNRPGAPPDSMEGGTSDGAGGVSLGAGGRAVAETGGVLDLGSGGAATGGAPSAVCGEVAFRTEANPVDLLVLFDQSASMGDSVPGATPPASWWQVAQAALARFLQDPGTAGNGDAAELLSVGIQYFPLDGIAPQSCSADYGNPEVELAPLPSNTAPLVASLKLHRPTSFTPTGPALAGALAHMKTWASNHPGHVPAVVLVTDGFPTECDPPSLALLAAMVSRAYGTEPRVRTFVVGFNLGVDGAKLNEVTVAGGSGAPYLIDRGDIGGQFVDAMLSVSSRRLPCRLELPATPMNVPLNPSELAVTWTPSATMIETFIPRLDGPGYCEMNAERGWYLDSLSHPPYLTLCPGTCSDATAGTLKVQSGCMTGTGITR